MVQFFFIVKHHMAEHCNSYLLGQREGACHLMVRRNTCVKLDMIHKVLLLFGHELGILFVEAAPTCSAFNFFITLIWISVFAFWDITFFVGEQNIVLSSCSLVLIYKEYANEMSWC